MLGYICLLWQDDLVVRFYDMFHALMEQSNTFSFHLLQNDCNIQGVSPELVPFLRGSSDLILIGVKIKSLVSLIVASNCTWQPYKPPETPSDSIGGSKGR